MCRILIAAHESNYHAKYLVSLFNEVRNTDAKRAEPDSDRLNHAIAIAEQVTYSEDARMNAIVAPAFVLADLAALYATRMEQLGTIVTKRVDSRPNLRTEY